MLNAPSGPAVTRAVTVAVLRAASSPSVEDAELRGGAARSRCLHAELLPEGAARARAARVHPLRSPPHPQQGAFTCSVLRLLCSVTSECPEFRLGGARASAERGAVYTAVVLTHSFGPGSAVCGSSGEQRCASPCPVLHCWCVPEKHLSCGDAVFTSGYYRSAH